MFDARNESGPLTERSKVAERFHWVAIAGLAVLVGGLCWYGYPNLRQLSGLQKSFERVNQHLAETDAGVKDWGRGQQQLQDHVAKLEKEVGFHSQAVSKQVRGLAAETRGTDAKLAQLESASAADRANLDKLQTEVATLREETAQQAEQLRDAQQLASLQEQIDREIRDAGDEAKKLATKRVDFEVTRNHSQELTEGVSLEITGADISHRRVTGWMWVMPDRRTIWLRGQEAQQPVVFYGYPDGQRRELVFTNVTRDSVTGYLLLPGNAGSNMTASVSKGD
jgi:chromosome segregation ATPase